MRISDWSSDVCSSDLPPLRTGGAFKVFPLGLYRNHGSGPFCRLDVLAIEAVHRLVCHFNHAHSAKAVKRRPHGAAIGAEHADLDIVPGAYIRGQRTEEHTYELQPHMRTTYAVICLKNKKLCKKI